MDVIALDTETTGVDHWHSARPFFVTIAFENGEQEFWEWSVDPLTRTPKIPKGDVEEIRERITSADRIVTQNGKFDVVALSTIGIRDWLWEKTEDTIIAGHLLASNQPHDLTSMVLHYLGEDLKPFEDAMEKAVKEARRKIQQARLKLRRGKGESDLAGWRIAEEKTPEAPSLSGKRIWRADTWLPRLMWLRDVEGTRKTKPTWETVTREYANADSMATLLLWREMEREIRSRSLWSIYRKRMESIPVAVRIETRGVTSDGREIEQLKIERVAESDNLKNRCVSIAKTYGFDLKMPKGASNGSLRDFCFEVLKLPPVVNKKAKSAAPSLDSKNAIPHYLATLPEKSRARLFVSALSRKRKVDTEISYLESYERFRLPLERGGPDGRGHFLLSPATCDCDGDGRCPVCDHGLGLCMFCRRGEVDLFEPCGENPWGVLHPNLNPTGTDTLRWSSSNPNSQNIKKDPDERGRSLRCCFGPAPGREWWSMDAKNIELRIPAYESGQQEFIDLFERPDDPPYFGSNHLLIAHLLFPREFEECLRTGEAFKTKYKSLYSRTKNGNFAVQYGAVDRPDGTGTADRTYGIPGAQARIKARFAKQEALNQKWIRFAEKHGFVETIPDKSVDPDRGYPILCSRTEWGRVLPTVPLNYHVQGTAMWWTMQAMIRCQAQLDQWRREDGFDGWIVLQVHDELVFDFPKRGLPRLDFEREKKSKLFRTRGTSNLWRIRVLQKLMSRAGDDMGVPTPVGVEYHSENWGKGVTL